MSKNNFLLIQNKFTFCMSKRKYLYYKNIFVNHQNLINMNKLSQQKLNTKTKHDTNNIQVILPINDFTPLT